MSKKSRKNKEPKVINMPSSYTKEEWIKIIADAEVKAEEIRLKKKEELAKGQSEEWRKILKVKNEKSKIKQFFNDVAVLARISMVKKDQVKGSNYSFVLLQMALSGMLAIIKWFFVIVSIYLLGNVIYLLAKSGLSTNNIYATLVQLPFALMFWLLSRIVRIAGYEVENMEAGHLLIEFTMIAISLFTLIFAIVAIFVK